MTNRSCRECGTSLPQHKRASAIYCTERCRKRAEHRRYEKRAKGKPARRSLDLRRCLITAHTTGIDLGRYYRALAHDPCAYCGGLFAQTDHIDPTSRGGEVSGWENVTASCEQCNRQKRDMTLLAHLVAEPHRHALQAATDGLARLRAVGPTRNGKRPNGRHPSISRHRTAA